MALASQSGANRVGDILEKQQKENEKQHKKMMRWLIISVVIGGLALLITVIKSIFG